MRFTPIVGTLIYVWDDDRDSVLIIRRNARRDDDHYGKINGLGGKLEVDEDVASSAQRELGEEADIEAAALELRGTITFTDFGPQREQWLVFVFLTRQWTGEIPSASDEGTLEWVQRSELLAACETPIEELPMWPGDRHFVPLVFDENPALFHGTMPYDADKPVSWSYVRD